MLSYAYAPFFGAIFWAAILAILFAPVYRRLLLSMRERRTPAALATEAIIVVMVILPAALISAALLQEGVVDNILRPILVGRDARMPEYVVLISTLGGMAIFGLNGFVVGPVIAAMFLAAWHIVATDNGGPG